MKTVLINQIGIHSTRISNATLTFKSVPRQNSRTFSKGTCRIIMFQHNLKSKLKRKTKGKEIRIINNRSKVILIRLRSLTKIDNKVTLTLCKCRCSNTRWKENNNRMNNKISKRLSKNVKTSLKVTKHRCNNLSHSSSKSTDKSLNLRKLSRRGYSKVQVLTNLRRYL